MASLSRWTALLLPLVLLAHEGGKTLQKPTAAAGTIKLARIKLDAAKKRMSYACCKRKSCDLCAQRYGKCECASNLAQNKKVCGQCLPQWRSKGVTLMAPTKAAPMSPESQEVAKLLLEAKRTLVKEQRYACCKRGGCDECTFEAECPCGKDLAASTKEKPKGVCGSCYDAWHAGEGSFSGIAPEEVTLAEMTGHQSGAMFVSGTAQIPNQAPMYMTETRKAPWTWMTMGQVFLTATQQSGPRGGDKLFSGNWFMPMASRKAGPGTLLLRGMFSLEPATVTSGSYPLLFQTGETYQGRPVINGQHPHSFFMELAALYFVPVRDNVNFYVYGGPRGEPALGPVAYPHRLSASENPLATLAHHYQDSTHIANNVVTAGLTVSQFTFEASGFNGREPGENRWQLETGSIDSWSARVSVKPTGRWLLQYSLGHIASRESLHPEENSQRQTASLHYVRPHAGGYWATSAIWGRNVDIHHQEGDRQIFNSYLLESTAFLRQKHWLWGRVEHTDKDATLSNPANEETRLAKVTAFSFGYGHELPSPAKWLSLSAGAQFNVYRTPVVLRPQFGNLPVGGQFYLRARLKSSRMTF